MSKNKYTHTHIIAIKKLQYNLIKQVIFQHVQYEHKLPKYHQDKLILEQSSFC